VSDAPATDSQPSASKIAHAVVAAQRPALVPKGVATFDLGRAFVAGSYTITTSYSGDGSFNGSTWRRDCLLNAMSDTDAILTVEGSIQDLKLKEFFLLLSSTGLAYRRCKLVRVNGAEIDIRFLQIKNEKERPVKNKKKRPGASQDA
jgi:hypothetical protein